jgi:hypothetical protein
MTSRRLRSAALIPVNRTSPVVLLALLLYGTAVWSSFEVLLEMPFASILVTFEGLLLCGLQIVAGAWIWSLRRRGAILATVVMVVKTSILAYVTYLGSLFGIDGLNLAGIVASFVVTTLMVGLLLASWHRMS